MSPEVTAAVIAAGVSFLTLIGTLAAQVLGRRATSRDTQKTFVTARAAGQNARGGLPSSSGERRMLRLAASLADQAPVSLGEAITGIDDHNVALLVKAVLHASGRRQFLPVPARSAGIPRRAVAGGRTRDRASMNYRFHRHRCS